MKTKSRKAIAAVIGILVAALLACSVLLVQYVKEDFAPQIPEASAPAENGGMLIGEGEGAGVSLLSEKIEKADYEAYGVSPLAESAYTLTATVEPANAPDKAVDWSVAFVNPASEWATGKTVTDYVTVTPTSDGALTATVQCLQAFGEQITVTVASRQFSGVNATCTVDFAKKIKSADVHFVRVETQETRDFTIGDEEIFTFTDIANNNTAIDETVNISYEDTYTIDENFTQTFKLILNQEYLSALKANAPEHQTYWDFVEFTEYVFEGDAITLEIYGSTGLMTFFNPENENSNDAFRYWLTNGANMDNAINAVLRENPDMYLCTLQYEAVGKYSSYTRSTKINIKRSDLTDYISEISLDDSSIIF